MMHRILWVVDNEDPAELVKRALEDEKASNQIDWVKDGQEALDFLYRKGAHINQCPSALVGLSRHYPPQRLRC